MVISFLTCSHESVLFGSTSNVATHAASSCFSIVFFVLRTCVPKVVTGFCDYRLSAPSHALECGTIADPVYSLELYFCPYFSLDQVFPHRLVMYLALQLSFHLLVILIPMMNNAHTSDSLSAQLPWAAIGAVASLWITSHNAYSSMFSLSSLFGSSFPRSACPLNYS
jgi:hypothetical protein